MDESTGSDRIAAEVDALFAAYHPSSAASDQRRIRPHHVFIVLVMSLALVVGWSYYRDHEASRSCTAEGLMGVPGHPAPYTKDRNCDWRDANGDLVFPNT